VATRFTVEDNQGLQEEVLKGWTLPYTMLSCPPRVEVEELCPSVDRRSYDSYSHSSGGGEGAPRLQRISWPYRWVTPGVGGCGWVRQRRQLWQLS